MDKTFVNEKINPQVGALAQYLIAERKQLISNFYKDLNVKKLLQKTTQLCDEIIMKLCQMFPLPHSINIIAIGGYGRRELFPYSDIDLMFLVDETITPPITPAIEQWVAAAWDIGFELSTSLRTQEQTLTLAEQDITIQTTMLEARLITGDVELFQRWYKRYKNAIDAKRFFQRKRSEQSDRHQRNSDTAYALEPNIKEAMGGLRDLHVLEWVTKASKLGNNFKDLLQSGLLTRFELQQLSKNQNFLWQLRAALHIESGKRDDRLQFDKQAAIAGRLGIKHSNQRIASEILMRKYYWAAKAVVQLNTIILLNIERYLFGDNTNRLSKISDEFYDRDGLLEVVDIDLFQRDTSAIMRLFYTYTQIPGLRGLSSQTLRALYNGRKAMGAQFRKNASNRHVFLKILQQPQAVTRVLRLMNATSVLGRYLWVFRRIVGAMQHDLFHVYTVDQHILMVVRNIRRFFLAEHAHEYPLCSELAAEFERPWVLIVAALFHDIGKGRGGDHSAIGAKEVVRFGQLHGLSSHDIGECEFLVKHHLVMSKTSQSQDLSNAEVIHQFARIVGNKRRLDALYLLTHADIRGTSPHVWSSWKGALLHDLYRLTEQAFLGESPSFQETVISRRARTHELLRSVNVDPAQYAKLWEELGASYFHRHSDDEVCWHTRSLCQYLGNKDIIVEARQVLEKNLHFFVYLPERRNLFVQLCCFFGNRNLSILDARIHTTQTTFALDSFTIAIPQWVDNPEALIEKLKTDLKHYLNSNESFPALQPVRLSRRVRSFPITPQVELSPDENGGYWLLSISAHDRPGLLVEIAQVMSQAHIELKLAKVMTLGERVEDTFLISGKNLNYPETRSQFQADLLEAMS